MKKDQQQIFPAHMFSLTNNCTAKTSHRQKPDREDTMKHAPKGISSNGIRHSQDVFATAISFRGPFLWLWA